ncbi:hypothetical protein BKA62DRAFT_676791 [Auriculariales sp. MPI-PUGE-AT-0066]|nr:hypothetical protein BKA62DRAFT_676791 [Auriculariales sp. MPI-PUGE-AT-0066]
MANTPSVVKPPRERQPWPNTKKSMKQIVDTADKIATAVVASCQQLQPGHLPIVANSLIIVTHESRTTSRKPILNPAECFSLRSAKPASEDLFVFRWFCDDSRRLVSLQTPDCRRVWLFMKGLKVVFQGMTNMSDAVDWPWKAIPQTILQFTSMIERSPENQTKIQDLSDRICQRIALLLNICIYEKRGRSDGELERYVEEFLCDTQRIIIRLRIGFPLTMCITKIIEDEATRMQTAQNDLEVPHCMHLQLQFAVRTTFTVTSIASGIAAVQATVKRTHEIVAKTRDGVRALLEGRSVETTHHVHVLARLHGRPEVLKGRTSDLMKYVSILCDTVLSRIVIIGPGGIGKTSLAKALLYSEEVVAIFGDRRFFISVGGVINMEAAIAQLAKQLGVQHRTDPLLASISFLMSLPRVLLVIDNLETLRFSKYDSAQAGTAQLFRRLKDITSLTLILSRPPETTAEEVSLKELLQAVDCVPLAVILLARLAKLAVSSTDTDAEAEQLPFVCALLPDGLRPEVLEQMADSFKNISGAKDLLLTFALVSLGREGDLIMLSPVRHFVLSQFPGTSTDQSTSSHLAALLKIYVRIAATAPQIPSEDFSSRGAAFVPEYGNISSYLLYLIRSEEPSQELFATVISVANYSYWTNPSTAHLDAFRPRLEGHSRWGISAAEPDLQSALSEFEALGSPYGVGVIQYRMKELESAAIGLARAEVILAHTGVPVTLVDCHWWLGTVYRDQNRMKDALDKFEAARRIYDKIDSKRMKTLAQKCILEIVELEARLQKNMSIAI